MSWLYWALVCRVVESVSWRKLTPRSCQILEESGRSLGDKAEAMDCWMLERKISFLLSAYRFGKSNCQ